MKPSRLVIGCMSGTSLDGLDAALVRIDGAGLAMRADVLTVVGRSFPRDLGEQLRQLADGHGAEAHAFVRAARALGEFHADAVAELCEEHVKKPNELDFVSVHGQTIFHCGEDHLSWQLFDPWPIVRRLGVPVCYDLRQADLIAGGQGAPVTPLADWILFRHRARSRLVVNLGGVCNVTYLPPAQDGEAARPLIRGGDIGPCNLLIDGMVRRLFPDRAFDEDGRIAAEADWRKIDLERDHPMVRAVVGASNTDPEHPHTLGREQFGEAWLEKLAATGAATTNEVARRKQVAWAVEAVARRIGQTIASYEPAEVVLAGGGAKNPVLVERIGRALERIGSKGLSVVPSDALGIAVDAREATAMAVLGTLSADGQPITIGGITGADQPDRAGAWVYP